MVLLTIAIGVTGFLLMSFLEMKRSAIALAAS
jgi:hypothetical protein